MMRNEPESCERGRDLSDSEWVVSIREKLEQATKDAASFSRKKLCIYRVPRRLRERNEKAYAPQVVTLGPYHHGNSQLCEMENQKWRILDHVLKRKKQDIKLYLDAVTEVEEEARSCYEGKIGLTKNQFIEMMVLDGIFVLELLQGDAKEQGFKELGYSSDDVIFSNNRMIQFLLDDMIKLENQLPLFILDTLLGLQSGNQNMTGEVAKLIPDLFRFLVPTIGTTVSSSPNRGDPRTSISYSLDKGNLISLSSYKVDLHCLDIFRESLLKISEPEKVNNYLDVFGKLKMIVLEKVFCCLATSVRSGEFVHCATELKEAGVKFKERNASSFWDITFENGILKIPRLKIDDFTKLLFLNLIAFEQCHPHCGNKITSYAIFMDSLINSEQDVAFLHKHKIIEHWLGNDAEVANLFNDLCKEVMFDSHSSYLFELSNNVNRYSKHKCNAWGASLTQKYFSNPWSMISLLAAVILLVLTFVQTIFTVKGYYKP